MISLNILNKIIETAPVFLTLVTDLYVQYIHTDTPLRHRQIGLFGEQIGLNVSDGYALVNLPANDGVAHRSGSATTQQKLQTHPPRLFHAVWSIVCLVSPRAFRLTDRGLLTSKTD